MVVVCGGARLELGYDSLKRLGFINDWRVAEESVSGEAVKLRGGKGG